MATPIMSHRSESRLGVGVDLEHVGHRAPQALSDGVDLLRQEDQQPLKNACELEKRVPGASAADPDDLVTIHEGTSTSAPKPICRHGARDETRYACELFADVSHLFDDLARPDRVDAKVSALRGVLPGGHLERVPVVLDRSCTVGETGEHLDLGRRDDLVQAEAVGRPVHDRTKRLYGSVKALDAQAVLSAVAGHQPHGGQGDRAVGGGDPQRGRGQREDREDEPSAVESQVDLTGRPRAHHRVARVSHSREDVGDVADDPLPESLLRIESPTESVCDPSATTESRRKGLHISLEGADESPVLSLLLAFLVSGADQVVPGSCDARRQARRIASSLVRLCGKLVENLAVRVDRTCERRRVWDLPPRDSDLVDLLTDIVELQDVGIGLDRPAHVGLIYLPSTFPELAGPLAQVQHLESTLLRPDLDIEPLVLYRPAVLAHIDVDHRPPETPDYRVEPWHIDRGQHAHLS
ncbi:MAG: hypothetical protein FWD18_05545 [Micrococcales bacterium]|nr:hypothetical protein [Micrococcales bacterium]